jgi:predicted CXXCH cytochrome family protein
MEKNIRQVILLGSILILLVSCSSNIFADPTDTPTVTVPTPTPDQSAYWDAWQTSIHANTYSLEKGPNTYCAKCHSPANWDKTAKIDDPPNCVSCKFANEDTPRIAEDNPLVSEEDWENIRCDDCHQVTDGVVEEQICWRDHTTGYCETVESVQELCGKCHRNTEVLRHERLIDHAHAEMQCTTCHNPHSLETLSCSHCHVLEISQSNNNMNHFGVFSNNDCERCHPDAWNGHNMKVKDSGTQDCINCHNDLFSATVAEIVVLGHSTSHENIPCVVCHDASGLEVERAEETDEWVLLRSFELLGRYSTSPYVSHSIQRQVDCTRCHYPENPWGLLENVTQ